MENIGSAALVADGIEARTDGLTSLAVVTGSAASSREHHRGEKTIPVPSITQEKLVLYGCIVGCPIETGILRADGSCATIARQSEACLSTCSVRSPRRPDPRGPPARAAARVPPGCGAAE